jgi:hypothetical protein
MTEDSEFMRLVSDVGKCLKRAWAAEDCMEADGDDMFDAMAALEGADAALGAMDGVIENAGYCVGAVMPLAHQWALQTYQAPQA